MLLLVFIVAFGFHVLCAFGVLLLLLCVLHTRFSFIIRNNN